MNVNIFGDIPDARLEEIRQASTLDSNLQTVIKLVLEGWPEEKRDSPSCVLPYFDIRDSLAVADGILLRGEAVVIPYELRASIKKRLHSSHLGYESMLRRARGTVFWPGMNSDIKQIADACEVCQQMKPKNVQEPLKQHADGDEPWQKIGLDFFQIADKYYLVAVDYYSNFIELDQLTTLTSTRTITLLKKHFSRYGIPRMIVSDGGPQFTSQEFDSFTKSWGITHVISSPMHQRANGKAESAVKIMKNLLTKTHKEGGDTYEAILEQRNTPRQDTGRSPAEMMFNRKTRSFLPTINSQLKDSVIREKRESRKDSVKKSHDRKSRRLSELDIGQAVFFQHLEGKNWKLGEITQILGPNTYQVKGPDGGIYRRNRVHMRPTKVRYRVRDLSPVPASHSTSEASPQPQLATPAPILPTDGEKKDDSQQMDGLPKDTGKQVLNNDRPRREIKQPIRFKDYITKW
jgi:transposase InsO family protein